MMENLPFAVRLMISATFKTFNEGPFLTKTVGELMWGYDSGLVDFLNKYLPGMLPSTGKFGLFAEVSAPSPGSEVKLELIRRSALFMWCLSSEAS